ncbi:MAG: hypothetical protein HUU35_09215 [Armatimonadetes bacterium]|nr:hypothetical protein [Armatimonadota bacterium]
MQLAAGDYEARWVDPASGAVGRGSKVTGGGPTRLTAAGTSPAVLLVQR